MSMSLGGTFRDALRSSLELGYPVVIPDIKLCSPKHGDLMKGRDPLCYAKSLISCGASVLSVVTEGMYFGGSLEILARLKKELGVPVLCKDFIHAREQLLEIKQAGADAVLLIASRLRYEELAALYDESLALELEPLVEVHTAYELECVMQLSPLLLGINNRDILQLEQDGGTVDTTWYLANLVSSRVDVTVISESGITTESDVRKAVLAGSTAVLVGTALLKADDSCALYRNMTNAAACAFQGGFLR